MNLNQYAAGHPLPPGTLKLGQPVQPVDAVNFCTFGLASEIAAQIAAAIEAIGTVSGLPAGVPAPAIADGTLPGGAYSGYTLADPPSTPPLPTDVSAWVYGGFFLLSKDTMVQAAGGPAIVKAGTLCQIYTESLGFLGARMVVSPQLLQGVDFNVLYAPSGTQFTVPTSVGLALQGPTEAGTTNAQALPFCVAPA